MFNHCRDLTVFGFPLSDVGFVCKMNGPSDMIREMNLKALHSALESIGLLKEKFSKASGS
jgi:hypothetical protein